MLELSMVILGVRCCIELTILQCVQDDANDSIVFHKSHRPPAHKMIFALSAPDQTALSRLGDNLAAYVDDIDTAKDRSVCSLLEQLAFTLSERRTTFQWRTSVIAGDTESLGQQLKALAKPERAMKQPKLLFCFTGQGAQWYAMGRELMVYDIYRESIQGAEAYLTSIGAAWSVIDELSKTKEESRINQPQLSQSLCTVLQVAMVDLLKHWGILPAAVVGHSSGEIAAAYAIGALSAEDCWKIAYHRGRLAGSLQVIAPGLKGGMLAVGLSEAAVQPYISAVRTSDDQALSVACVNSPASVTVSGDVELLDKMEGLLKADAIFARRLAVENAYHSIHMDHLADDYLESIKGIQPTTTPGKSIDATMVSSVTGKPVQAAELGPAYWVSNMVSPVQFLGAVEGALNLKAGERRKNVKIDAVVEIGPHSALQGPVKQILKSLGKVESTAYLTAIRRGLSADTSALQLAGDLWSRGTDVKLDLSNSLKAESRTFIPLSDLPKYPWNHETHYWHESTPSKSHRFRHAPRTDLLGYPVNEFSMLEPQWKNIIYLSELPWISDHKVQGNDVFPAAGMICAALEGARQIADKSRIVDAFELRDISISRALIIPSSDPGVDVFTRLNPVKTGYTETGMSPWYTFTFSSLETPETKESKYVEHARGLVAIIYRSEPSELSTVPDEASMEASSLQLEYEAINRSSKVEVSKAMHYANTLEMGFDYGPTFQGLTSAKIGHGQAAFTIEITNTAAIMPVNFEYEHLLHPSTLDAAIQSASQAMRMSVSKTSESMVPTGFERLRVSAAMPKGANTQLVGFSKARRVGYRDNLATIVISDPTWAQTMLEIHNLGFTGLGETDQIMDDDQSIALRKMCTEICWKADIDLLDIDKGHAQMLFSEGVESPEELDDWGLVATKATAIFIKRALAYLTPDLEQRLSSSHLKHLVSWMRTKYTLGAKGELDYQRGANWINMHGEQENEAIDTYSKRYPEDGLLVCAIGQNLPAILSGTVQPLEVMLQNEMLTTIYSKGHTLRSGLPMFQQWFDLQGHKNPAMNILEIGAGTGSVTLPVLQILGGSGGRTPRFSSYCFTDVSTGWFEKAQEMLNPWQGRMQFKKLNIEEDFFEQGFEVETFDVIAASNVLHATKRMDATLANCFRLLKPGGKLVIGELTSSQDCIGLAFGTLPGWWLSEDGREGGPLMTQAEWHRRLQASGFSGLDMAVGATDTSGDAKLSMLVSTKPRTSVTTGLQRVVIIKPEKPSQTDMDVPAALKALLTDVHVDVVDLTAASSRARAGDLARPHTSIISLLDSNDHLFVRCSKEDFNAVRDVILQSTRLLWVTCHASESGIRSPESCAISGLFRAAKSENDRLFLRELHLQKKDSKGAAGIAEIIIKVVKSAWAAGEDAEYEDEIVEANGMLTIPRLFDEEHLNRTLQTIGMTPQPELHTLSSAARPLALSVARPGLLDTLHFVDDTDLLAPLAVDEVLVEVKSAALNQE